MYQEALNTSSFNCAYEYNYHKALKDKVLNEKS
jgi:hypothetical protein